MHDWDPLYRQTRDSLTRYVVARLGRRGRLGRTPDGLVQEVWVRAIDAVHRGQWVFEQVNLKLLLRIARNAIIDLARRNRGVQIGLDTDLSIDGASLLVQLAVRDTDAAELEHIRFDAGFHHLDVDRRFKLVRACLESLIFDTRSAFVLAMKDVNKNWNCELRISTVGWSYALACEHVSLRELIDQVRRRVGQQSAKANQTVVMILASFERSGLGQQLRERLRLA
jgi:DNA-directed RNA polymerase specialized sigma24 family protein